MIKISVPATTANIGPGFDCLGIALSLYNIIEVEETSNGLMIEVNGEGQHRIETDENNLVYKSMMKGFEAIGYQPKGLKIKLQNQIPIARGLGSSAACIVGGLVAANRICNNFLDLTKILELAAEIEGHPDNVAAALFGGVVVSNEVNKKIYYIQFPFPKGIRFIVAIPDLELSTKKAREVLPQCVPFEDAVSNIGRVSLLVAAFLSGKLEVMDIALQDRIHQPYRLKLMDSLEKIFHDAKKVRLNNLFLSGAGPSVILFSRRDLVLEEVKFREIINKLPERWHIKVLEGTDKGVNLL